MLETIRANEFKACYIRPIVYRGYDALGVNPFPCPVDAAILTWEWGAYLGQDALEHGVDVRVSSWSRAAPNTFPTLAKSVGELRELAADQDGSDRRRLQRRHRARHARATSAKAAARTSSSSATTSSTRRRSAPSILPGITRDSVITLARDLGFTVREEMLPREMLYIADEAFFVGTAAEITPIRSVDKITDRQRAAAGRSPRRIQRRSSTSSTARCPTATAG